MFYRSTRSTKNEGISASLAIKLGLAEDGGLYMPSEIPSITKEEIISLADKGYAERAAYILGKFLNDYTEEELLADCEAAYSEQSFSGGAAPVKKVCEGLYSLELWHGPTCAFKDMALQIMPRLLSRALVKNNEKNTALILVATSGDTGKAALEGYKDIDQIKIMVFYPVNGVSRVQKLQMATQTGSNVDVCAIRGNFDDAQSAVKEIFADADIKDELLENNVILSSANSINWGRLAPQIAYYVSAYCDMLKSGDIAYGDKIDVCVPTGNFGNIFAGFIAKKMGLPIGKFICASNKNNILTDFLSTGTYDRNRDFYTTISPSMDILISSNLERLLYLTCGAEKTAKYMSELKENGKYTVEREDFAKISSEFVGFSSNEDETRASIHSAFNDYTYLLDTHTAVALTAINKYKESNKANKVLMVSTASPYKFACDVYTALTGKAPTDELAAIDELSEYTKTDVPAPLSKIGERKIIFTRDIDKKDMRASVLSFAKN